MHPIQGKCDGEGKSKYKTMGIFIDFSEKSLFVEVLQKHGTMGMLF